MQKSNKEAGKFQKDKSEKGGEIVSYYGRTGIILEDAFLQFQNV